MVMMNRREMINELRSGICEVEFTKVNGETRVMKCTLDPNIIPAATKEDPLSQKKVRAVNEEVLPVWDINKEQWRSFRIENVTRFN
jgi:hypothetical protein